MKSLLTILLAVIASLSSCASDPRKVESDVGGALQAAGAISTAVGHPEYGIPATVTGKILVDAGSGK